MSRECSSASYCVSAFGGYALHLPDPPDFVVWANPEEDPLPDSVEMRYGEGATIWGKGQILWQEGDWVEISADSSYTGMGVQVYGDKTIGWARVLFDGLEVWRGNTSTVWSDGTGYAVYVEVAGIAPGMHTLRIEALGIDGGGGGQSRRAFLRISSDPVRGDWE